MLKLSELLQGYPPELQVHRAFILRKRPKGRDFYDIVFLLSRSIEPNYAYLHQKLGVSNAMELKARIKVLCTEVDLAEMAKDVQPFLFYPNDEKKVRLFEKIVDQSIL